MGFYLLEIQECLEQQQNQQNPFLLPHIPQFLISWLLVLLNVKNKKKPKTAMTSEISEVKAPIKKKWVLLMQSFIIIIILFYFFFVGESQSFKQYRHVAISSLVRKMGNDMSVQFFVRNIHLHEESRVKNLICKAI